MSEIILKFEPNIDIRHTCHGDISYLSYVDSDSASDLVNFFHKKNKKGYSKLNDKVTHLIHRYYTTVPLRPNESKMGGNTARDTNTHILTLTFQMP